jgi:hypothetical protein
MRLVLAIIISFVFLSSCKDKNHEYAPLNNKTKAHQIKVKEVLQASTYTYLFVNENKEDYWIAVSKVDIKVDDHLFYNKALEMKDFKSEELDRTFDRILFVEDLGGMKLKTESIPNDSLHNKLKEQEKKPIINVDLAPDGIRIAELMENRDNYANKKIIIRGQVVKINAGIMDRNWVHLKDGTSHSGKSDLTFTTQEEVKVGDVVTFEGTVAVEIEYGAGYVYPLIVENAILK